MQYCYNGNDYYAGAAAACGGKQNLPSAAQLAELADYLYNTSGIGANENKSGLTLDKDKVAELGFSGGTFFVWSSQEYTSSYAYYRYFSSTYTYWDYPNCRDDSRTQAVCLIN